MNPVKIFCSGFAGTSMMTLFSYSASAYSKANFKEPVLLAALLKDHLRQKELALPVGWVTHYSMGISWATLFQLLFEKGDWKPGLKNALLLGSISGLTGIAIWRLAFKNKPPKQSINYRRFYRHLFLAHLVYSLTVTATVRTQ